MDLDKDKAISHCHRALKDLIVALEPTLTNPNHSIRSKGVKLLAKIVCGLPKDHMNKNEIETIFTFMDHRLEDHESMQEDVINTYSRLINFVNKPERFVPMVFDSIQHKISVSKVSHSTRKLVYQLVSDIVFQHDEEARAMGNNFIIGLIHLIDGENHPECLMLAFRIVSHVARHYELDGFADDFVEWFSLYFPLDYTPPQGQEKALKRQDLASSLYDCFVANPKFAESVMSLVLEKIESNLESSKLDAYECLTYCINKYPFEKVKTFASSVWACVRLDCLAPLANVTDKVRKYACRALLSMTEKMSHDNLLFATFTEDIYNDLSLAFIRIELDLYEPATILMVTAVQPRLSGFVYLLSKVMATPEMLTKDLEKKITSLTLIFQRLYEVHQDKLADREFKYIDELLSHTLDMVSSSNPEFAYKKSALDLIVSIIRCRLKMSQSTLERVSHILMKIVDSQREVSTICTCMETLKTIQACYNSSIVSRLYLKSLPEPACSTSQDLCLKNLANIALVTNESFISKSLESLLVPKTCKSSVEFISPLNALLMLLLDQLVVQGQIDKAIEYWMPLYTRLAHKNSCESYDKKITHGDHDLEALSLSTLEKVIVTSHEKTTAPYLNDLLTVCLNFSKTGQDVGVRQESLRCIATIASVHDDSDLIPYRPKMVQELRHCLGDRKRLVRSQAVVARNSWLMVGQPGRPRTQQLEDSGRE